MLVAADMQRQHGSDWKDQHPSGGEVLGWYLEIRNGERPPESQIRRWGAACQQIAAEGSRGQIIRAIIGMSSLWEHATAKSPWDPFDLRRKFAKALDAFPNHPAIQRYLTRQRFLEENP